MTTEEIIKTVSFFPTKNKEGFTDAEIQKLITNFPEINLKRFYSALQNITCMSINDEIVTYHSDVQLALRLGLDNREMTQEEFD